MSALQLGAVGAYLMIVAFAGLLFCAVIGLLTIGATHVEVLETTTSWAAIAIIVWIPGSFLHANGWAALRLVMPGSARAVALAFIVSSAAGLLTPLLQLWRVSLWPWPFLAIAAAHASAAWWYRHNRARLGRSIAIAHALTALAALLVLAGFVSAKRQHEAAACVALGVMGVAGAVASFATARLMKRARPYDGLERAFD